MLARRSRNRGSPLVRPCTVQPDDWQSTAVTTYAGLSLRNEDGTPSSGAAFELRDIASATRSVTVNGWTTNVVQGSKACVARGPARSSFEDAFADGLFAANIGLDLICFMKSERLIVEKRDEDNLVWWTDANDPTAVRVAVTGIMTTEFSVGDVTLVAHDADGKVIPPIPGPPLSWHPSFRFYRVSQTTTNLHDAYRNAFLAIECLLDHIEPQKAGETEGGWFKRAMNSADQIVSIRATLGGIDPDPVLAAVKEFYVDGRTAVAHSKASRTFVLPENHENREALRQKLSRLGQLYVALAQQVLGMRRSAGFVFPAVFRKLAETIDHYAAFASDDPSPLGDLDADQAPNPAGGSMVAMRLVDPTVTIGPFAAQSRWEVSGTDLADIECVRRVVGVTDKGGAAYASVLAEPLLVDSNDWLEFRLGMQGGNRSDIRTRFAS